jgi:hypothetical protein
MELNSKGKSVLQAASTIMAGMLANPANLSLSTSSMVDRSFATAVLLAVRACNYQNLQPDELKKGYKHRRCDWCNELYIAQTMRSKYCSTKCRMEKNYREPLNAEDSASRINSASFGTDA